MLTSALSQGSKLWGWAPPHRYLQQQAPWLLCVQCCILRCCRFFVSWGCPVSFIKKFDSAGQTHTEYSLCQSHRVKAVDIEASEARGIKCAQWNLLKHAKGKKQASKQKPILYTMIHTPNNQIGNNQEKWDLEWSNHKIPKNSHPSISQPGRLFKESKRAFTKQSKCRYS